MLEERKDDPIVRGADGVARGVILLHKVKQLERPMQSVCPLEIRSTEHEPEQAADPKSLPEEGGEQLWTQHLALRTF